MRWLVADMDNHELNRTVHQSSLALLLITRLLTGADIDRMLGGTVLKTTI